MNSDVKEKRLFNVVGTIPGAYEPTRYVLISGHHDAWQNESSKPGMTHSTLMEIARTFGHLHRHGWKPGRSLLFASWDGEEIGRLGSTSWLFAHSKELSSRAVAHINLDYELDGASHDHVAGSPIFRNLIEQVAKSVHCDDGSNLASNCSLFSTWLRDETHEDLPTSDHLDLGSTNSAFQNILGVSSVQVALKGPSNNYGTSSRTPSHIVTTSNQREFLEPKFRFSALVARFVTLLALKLTSTPELPVSVRDYSDRLHTEVREFLRNAATNAEIKRRGIDLGAIAEALHKFEHAAEKFHSTYDASFPMEFLAHHEYSDQLLEMERAFLLPATASRRGDSGSVTKLLRNPFRHAIYGPNPMNLGQNVLFPHLSGALDAARFFPSDEEVWEAVERELFFVVDALESASCVLDNHLIYSEPIKSAEDIHAHSW